jgi:predicted AlkP superfamily pyrophosphatase or phosphodiesterase
MNKTVVLLVVGLTQKMLGEHTPALSTLAKQGAVRPLKTITPAVTCSVQATFMTGLLPRDHGCVANGWYFRDLAEVLLWRQPENLVHGEKIWDEAKRRDSSFTCAKLFWWYNMYGAADWAATPRPMYPADGRKIPDVWTHPGELRDELTQKLGPFPLFKFWGPMADITCSEWIGRCALHVYETRHPTLTLVYLPHLDYPLQRLGPHHPEIAKELRAVDAICGEIIERAQNDGASVAVLSEYGMTDAKGAILINRALRRAGWLRVRNELGRDVFDAGASDAFAMADHQIAHIYVKNRERIGEVKSLVAALPGVEHVLDEDGKRSFGLDHPNSGELVATADAGHWFAYYYWLDDARAPDYARTVDIHRKPGYDPVELFIDPKIPAPKLKAAWILLKKTLGFRTLMELIGLDTSLVKGTHGRPTDDPMEGPVFITSRPELLATDAVEATEVKSILLNHIFKSP